MGGARGEIQGYEPGGFLLPGRNYSSSSCNYGFNGKPKDDEIYGSTGTSYDFGARLYDPRVGRWLSVDPMAHERSWLSPYNFVQNNPINRIDPNGALDSPIYDAATGDLLGTDNEGLKGAPVIMDRKDFKQGMDHADAMKLDKGLTALKGDAIKTFFQTFGQLSERPDYDGVLTKKEADAWWKGGSGKPLYVDESKISLPGITTGTFGNKVGNTASHNFGLPNPLSPTGSVYGRLDMTLQSADGKVSLGYLFNGISPNGLVMDYYNFEPHAGEPVRNFLTRTGKPSGSGADFDIHGYGFATVPIGN